jgi:hypothetical protein
MLLRSAEEDLAADASFGLCPITIGFRCNRNCSGQSCIQSSVRPAGRYHLCITPSGFIWRGVSLYRLAMGLSDLRTIFVPCALCGLICQSLLHVISSKGISASSVIILLPDTIALYKAD